MSTPSNLDSLASLNISIFKSQQEALEAIDELDRTVYQNPWIIEKPLPKQAVFLLHNRIYEGLFGGAASGGKSKALLTAAAQYVDVPGYAALILRNSFPDLNQPGALIPRSKEWWYGQAHYHETEHRWTFPSGATITFGYLDSDNSVFQYKSSEFQFVAIDEVTDHTEFRYTYLASRQRKPEKGPLAHVPLRLRAATNPGGPGAEWVKRRFIPDEYFKASVEERFSRSWYHEGRFFVPARREDNPTVNQAEYEQSLAVLDPLTRAQLRDGDWEATADGRFKREWFETRHWHQEGSDPNRWYINDRDPKGWQRVDLSIFTIVDLAISKKTSADYTVFGTFARAPGNDLLVLEIERKKLGVDEIVPALLLHCQRHQSQWVGMESVGFQSKLAHDARKQEGMPPVRELMPASKGKLERALPAILRAEARQIILPRQGSADWRDSFLAEVCAFMGDGRPEKDDQTDVLAYSVLACSSLGLDIPTQSVPAAPRPAFNLSRLYGRPGRSPFKRR